MSVASRGATKPSAARQRRSTQSGTGAAPKCDTSSRAKCVQLCAKLLYCLPCQSSAKARRATTIEPKTAARGSGRRSVFGVGLFGCRMTLFRREVCQPELHRSSVGVACVPAWHRAGHTSAPITEAKRVFSLPDLYSHMENTTPYEHQRSLVESSNKAALCQVVDIQHDHPDVHLGLFGKDITTR